MAAYFAKPPKGSTLRRGDPLAKWLAAAWLFNEKGGPTVYDAAGGKAGNGTLTGFNFTTASGWATGPRGACLLFDGTDDWISATVPAATGDFAVRFAADQASGGDGLVPVATGTFGGSGFYVQLYSTATNLVRIHCSGSTLDYTPPGGFWGNWHEYLFRRVGGNGEIWIDGVRAAGPTAMNAPGSSTSLRIGQYPGGGFFYAGRLDGVMYWIGGSPSPTALAADPFRPWRRRSVAVLKAAAAVATGPAWFECSDPPVRPADRMIVL